MWQNFKVGLTFGLMLLMRQKARCFWMLSMVWQCCLLVVRRYFCRARAMEGNTAKAASCTSMMSDGVACSSSFFIRRTCVKASSTATTSLTERRQQLMSGVSRNLPSTCGSPGSTFTDSSLIVGLFVVQLVVGGVLLAFGSSCNHGPWLTLITRLRSCCVPGGCT